MASTRARPAISNVAQAIAETLALESPETRADFKQLLGLLNGPAFGLLTVGRPRSFMKMAAGAARGGAPAHVQ